MTDTVQHLSLLQILIATSLVVFSAIVSVFFGLKLEKQLGIAALRTIGQLFLVGYILKYVFTVHHPALVLLLIVIMVAFAAHASVSRAKRRYARVQLDAFLTLTASSIVTGFIVTGVIIQIHPWYRAQYVIPLIGMILGNSLTGISIALDQLLGDLSDRRDTIEMELAHGASAWEAARGPLADAVRRGMIPTINSMVVVGIVSLPGMMTGQILAGSDPLEAVKYQIVVMFMLAAATALGCMMITLLAYRRLFNAAQQLEEGKILRS
ncbi:MAG: iron export ABC transporter permease subunit FetB [Capsulimonas sp.]|jgi:putative ABC transport system permease protein|uniref:ABC transporter permease n=1 Tax=Capsulimonas sp. TaxID=2494211 RepID=UPI0032632D99|nr:iron export transporter permease subunit FetB [Capsulimonas sp.]